MHACIYVSTHRPVIHVLACVQTSGTHGLLLLILTTVYKMQHNYSLSSKHHMHSNVKFFLILGDPFPNLGYLDPRVQEKIRNCGQLWIAGCLLQPTTRKNT